MKITRLFLILTSSYLHLEVVIAQVKVIKGRSLLTPNPAKPFVILIPEVTGIHRPLGMETTQ